MKAKEEGGAEVIMGEGDIVMSEQGRPVRMLYAAPGTHTAMVGVEEEIDDEVVAAVVWLGVTVTGGIYTDPPVPLPPEDTFDDVVVNV